MNVLVTSAMRTGSTWLVVVLRDLLQAGTVYAADVLSANLAISNSERVVVKSHELHDEHWEHIAPEARIVRILRNYKDSLISRALYVRNIRTAENNETSEQERRDLLPDSCSGDEEAILSAFIDNSPLVEQWLREIVIMERGWSSRVLTVLYEALQHNPLDGFIEIVSTLWPEWQEGPEKVVPVVRYHMCQGLELRKGIYRNKSVGVAGWEKWLTAEQATRLDERYYHLRMELDAQ